MRSENPVLNDVPIPENKAEHDERNDDYQQGIEGVSLFHGFAGFKKGRGSPPSLESG